MYGLKQVAQLAYNNLVKYLSIYGHVPNKICQIIRSHKTRKTKFCLCVDEFVVKIINEHGKKHLVNELHEKYETTIDTFGKKICGLTLD